MEKRIALFCALIGVLALAAGPAFAEVQNIKVSGDIQALGIYRNNYDMEDGRVVQGNGANDFVYSAEDEDSMLVSIARLRVDADLTDNVSACVRLANLREWDTTLAAADDIVIDLASITLKELLYSPLTVVVGRQELLYGKGLIVGPGLFRDSSAALAYDDLSPLQAYDAVRAILDYDPWTVELVAAKMYESDDDASGAAVGRNDDTDLYGVNLGHKFGSYSAEMEGYFFAKNDQQYNLVINVNGSDSNGRTFEENKVYTMGLRGSMVPLTDLTLSGEVAGQLGRIIDDQAGPDDKGLERDRQGMAANAAAEYKFANVRFIPVVGVEYLYTSGEEAGNNGDFEAWDPMYRSKFMGTIRDTLENLYRTNDVADTNAWTNQHTLKASGGLDLNALVEGLSLKMAYLHYWFDEEPIAGADDEIGDELNMKLTYDYTEDVQFGLDGAVFFPGKYYDKALHNPMGALVPMEGGSMALTTNAQTNRTANDNVVSVVGSCKVTF